MSIELREDGGVFIAEYEWRTYRFLMSNGETIDVRAILDDSTLRTAVLAEWPKTLDVGIVGVAKL